MFTNSKVIMCLLYCMKCPVDMWVTKVVIKYVPKNSTDNALCMFLTSLENIFAVKVQRP
jgi:hypothetical protein